MPPAIAGEHAPRRQIPQYSLVLLAATVDLFVMRAMGLLYLDAPLTLGGGLLLADRPPRPPFWRRNPCHA